ncbi:MAG TPA: ATP:cob(I)alamin adenosyltransferase [Candidatus Paceibacterota bacterium]|nr:ATP:cob(I)alamin adenosyltransferase [Candidatus Paceibacterota bacterium]
MALFTGKGDDGTTYAFGCDQRFSKSSIVAEALGSLDEINSYLGFAKLESRNFFNSKKFANTSVASNTAHNTTIAHDTDAPVAQTSENFKFSDGKNFEQIIGDVQQNLFIIQAQIAGAPKTIVEEKIKILENYIVEAEKNMPPIKTFFVSGGCQLSSLFDFARTIARRAERRVVAVSDENLVKVDKTTLSYLNRLSSLLYAMARLSNHFSGIKEEAPNYR